jgi:hypothetical protein
VSSRLRALTAHRAALQAEIALQRDDARQSYAEIEHGTTRVDRGVQVLQRLGPLLLVAGAAGLIALGPARALSLARRGLTFGLFVSHARRLLR